MTCSRVHDVGATPRLADGGMFLEDNGCLCIVLCIVLSIVIYGSIVLQTLRVRFVLFVGTSLIVIKWLVLCSHSQPIDCRLSQNRHR